MEVEWIADRATLCSLAKPHPEWTQRDLAETIGRSLSWVKKWLKRRNSRNFDEAVVIE